MFKPRKTIYAKVTYRYCRAGARASKSVFRANYEPTHPDGCLPAALLKMIMFPAAGVDRIGMRAAWFGIAADDLITVERKLSA
jgi:hypothetical protein